MLVENDPPVTVPEYFSATPAPSRPTLPGNVSVKVLDLPGAIEATLCGSGVPDVAPSVPVLNVTSVTVPAPVFVTVIVKVYPPPWDPAIADEVESETEGAETTDNVP